nr:hypothetical protein [Bacillus licheniformis]
MRMRKTASKITENYGPDCLDCGMGVVGILTIVLILGTIFSYLNII